MRTAVFVIIANPFLTSATFPLYLISYINDIYVCTGFVMYGAFL